jgi:hypothetical protein
MSEGYQPIPIVQEWPPAQRELETLDAIGRQAQCAAAGRANLTARVQAYGRTPYGVVNGATAAVVVIGGIVAWAIFGDGRQSI